MQEIITVTDGFTLNPGDLSWHRIGSLGNLQYFDRTQEEEMVSRCSNATIIITNKTPVSGEVIQRCEKLKLIAVSATGYNIIDVKTAAKRGVEVCNVPGYGTDSVAQHTFALLLELANHVGQNADSVRRGEWSLSKDFCYTKAPLMELAGKTLGVVGYGQIGRKVAEIAKAFSMNVIYSRSSGSGDPNARTVEQLFAESDVVTLHCPLTPGNEGFVSLELLKTMKRNAFLINTARGQLIREADLAQALREGVLRGAGLDVLSKEPPLPTNPLINAPNCIITPHNAWFSIEARRRIMSETFLNIQSFLEGNPRNLVTR